MESSRYFAAKKTGTDLTQMDVKNIYWLISHSIKVIAVKNELQSFSESIGIVHNRKKWVEKMLKNFCIKLSGFALSSPLAGLELICRGF